MLKYVLLALFVLGAINARPSHEHDHVDGELNPEQWHGDDSAIEKEKVPVDEENILEHGRNENIEQIIADASEIAEEKIDIIVAAAPSEESNEKIQEARDDIQLEEQQVKLVESHSEVEQIEVVQEDILSLRNEPIINVDEVWEEQHKDSSDPIQKDELLLRRDVDELKTIDETETVQVSNVDTEELNDDAVVHESSPRNEHVSSFAIEAVKDHPTVLQAHELAEQLIPVLLVELPEIRKDDVLEKAKEDVSDVDTPLWYLGKGTQPEGRIKLVNINLGGAANPAALPALPTLSSLFPNIPTGAETLAAISQSLIPKLQLIQENIQVVINNLNSITDG